MTTCNYIQYQSQMESLCQDLSKDPLFNDILEKYLGNMKKTELQKKFIAYLSEGNFFIAKKCIKYLGNVNYGDRFGIYDTFVTNPLLWASYGGRYEVVKFLVENGANVNYRSVDKDTPISLAFSQCHIEIVIYLYKNGASTEVNGKYLTDYAPDYINSDKAKKYMELIKYLETKVDELTKQIHEMVERKEFKEW